MSKTNDTKLISQAPNFYSEISIEGYQIPPNNIMYCCVKEDIFDVVSSFELHFIDSGIFTELSPIHEGKVFDIIFSKNKTNQIVNSKFKVENFEIKKTVLGNGSYNLIKIAGVQNNKNVFYPIRNRAFRSKDSSTVLEEILSVEFEVDKRVRSKDTQTWLQCNQSDFDFIKHIKEKSYVQDQDLMFCYTGRDSKTVITSLKTEIEKQKKTKFQAVYDLVKFEDRGIEDSIKETVDKETKDSKKEMIYIGSFEFRDNSGIFNKKSANGVAWSYLDVDSSELIIDEITTPLAPFTEYSKRSEEGAGQVVDSLTWSYKTPNVHENYIKSRMGNKYYTDMMFSSALIITVGGNENIKLFDRIQVLLPSQLESNLDNGSGIDIVNSGDYIVGGIKHKIGKGSRFLQVLTLFRGGTNRGAFEKDFKLNLEQVK